MASRAALQAGLESLPGVTRVPRPAGCGQDADGRVHRGRSGPGPGGQVHAPEEAVFVTNGDFYATTLAGRMGVAGSGGWVRAGLAPYIDQAEVGRALAVLEQAFHGARFAWCADLQAAPGGQLREDSVMEITGMHHIGLTVASLERSLAYYKEMFGLEPEFVATGDGDDLSRAVGVPGAKLTFAFLRVGAGTVELIEYRQRKADPLRRPQLRHGRATRLLRRP